MNISSRSPIKYLITFFWEASHARGTDVFWTESRKSEIYQGFVETVY